MVVVVVVVVVVVITTEAGKFECERRSLAQNKRRKSQNQPSGVNKSRFLHLQKQQVKNPRAGF